MFRRPGAREMSSRDTLQTRVFVCAVTVVTLVLGACAAIKDETATAERPAAAPVDAVKLHTFNNV